MGIFVTCHPSSDDGKEGNRKFPFRTSRTFEDIFCFSLSVAGLYLPNHKYAYKVMFSKTLNHYYVFSPLQVPVLKPMELMVEASPRRIFANAHTYHINSISVNSDGETYLSADDLRINLWHMEITDQSFNIVDIKPANMEELTEVRVDFIISFLMEDLQSTYCSWIYLQYHSPT